MEFIPETLWSVAQCDGTNRPLLEALYVKVLLHTIAICPVFAGTSRFLVPLYTTSRRNPGCYPVMGARNTAWTGNVWYSALLRELIFGLKVRQKAGICIKNCKIFLFFFLRVIHPGLYHH